MLNTNGFFFALSFSLSFPRNFVVFLCVRDGSVYLCCCCCFCCHYVKCFNTKSDFVWKWRIVAGAPCTRCFHWCKSLPFIWFRMHTAHQIPMDSEGNERHCGQQQLLNIVKIYKRCKLFGKRSCAIIQILFVTRYPYFWPKIFQFLGKLMLCSVKIYDSVCSHERFSVLFHSLFFSLCFSLTRLRSKSKCISM